jgi:tetratricopeptide (TPR) repeat protein
MRYASALLLVVAGLTWPVSLLGQGAVDSLAARGDSALARGDGAAAQRAFDEALRLRPHDASLLQRRGRALREQGKLTEALAAYDQAVTADTAFGPAYGGRAYTRYLLDDLDGAVSDVARSRAAGVTDPQLALVAGMALGRLGRFADSERELDTFVAAYPHPPDGWYYRAIARARLGKSADALTDFGRAEAAGMTAPPLYAERALVYEHLGNHEAACTDLRRAADGGLAQAKELLGKLCK